MDADASVLMKDDEQPRPRQVVRSVPSVAESSVPSDTPGVHAWRQVGSSRCTSASAGARTAGGRNSSDPVQPYGSLRSCDPARAQTERPLGS